MKNSIDVVQPFLFEGQQDSQQTRQINRFFGNMHGEVVGGKDEWLTPPWIIEALGRFDLDPCAPIYRPWDTAIRHYTIKDNGLLKPWEGRVWLNPPYGSETWKWVGRMAEHGNGICLTFARTETVGFHRYVWNRASGILFFRGRIKFYNVDGTEAENSAGAPSCLIAYGKNNYNTLLSCSLDGKTVKVNEGEQ